MAPRECSANAMLEGRGNARPLDRREQPRPRANPDPARGALPFDSGSPGKPFLVQEVLHGRPIGGSFGRDPEPPRNLLPSDALGGLPMFGFFGVGPKTSRTMFLQGVLGGLHIFRSFDPDPKFLGGSGLPIDGSFGRGPELPRKRF